MIVTITVRESLSQLDRDGFDAGLESVVMGQRAESGEPWREVFEPDLSGS